MRAAFYGRFSSDKQRETSIDDQYRNCERYAQRLGWTISKRYEDKAISGKANRPGYDQMLVDAGKQFAVLLVDDLSRLTRDDEGPVPTISRLKFRGVRVVSVTDGVDSDSKSYKVQAGVRGILNNVFLDDLAEKVHRGLTGQAMKGFSCGGRPYGYKPVPILSKTEKDPYGRPAVEAVKREIDPAQAKVVRLIFGWYGNDQWSPRKIADELNRRKVPSPGSTWKRTTRRCNGWVGSSVLSILGNPLYIGRYIWNRGKWERDPDTKIHKRRARPESEWVETAMPNLAIVTKQQWDAVQARQMASAERNKAIQAAQGPRARDSRVSKYLFSSLLVCGVCGANYVIKDSHRYGCGGFRDGGKHNCSNRLHVSRRLAETLLLRAIKDDLFSAEAMDRLKRRLVEIQAERKKAKRPDLEGAQKELAGVEAEIGNIVAAVKAGAFSSALKTELAALEAKREQLQAVLKLDTRRLDNIVQLVPNLTARYKAIVEDMEGVTVRDVARARAQLRTLLEGKVPLHPTPEGILEARLTGRYEGVIKLAVGHDSSNWFGRGRGI